MLTEFVVIGALLLLKHWFPVFWVICAIGLVHSVIKWRAMEDRSPFLRAIAQGLRDALAVRSRLMWVSRVMVISALGFVSGLWPGWVVTVVVALAVWAMWSTSARWFPTGGRQRPIST